MPKTKTMRFREYTKEESFYRRLLYAYLHYDGDSSKAFAECEKLLKEVMESDLQNDFKEHFKNLWEDQVSKLHDSHKNYYEGLKRKFERAIA